MPIAAVLFDVDGTLVDTNYHHTIAWSRALRAHGHHPPLSAIHRLIGMGGSELLEELIGEASDEIEAAWRERFEELVPEVDAFEGAADLLRAVHDRGITVVLATSSPEDLFEALRTKLGADDAIDAVTTSGDVENAKPRPDIFEVARGRSGADASQTVVVGDSVWDVAAATRAGLRCVAVEVGGYSAAELRDAGAAAVLRDPRALLDQLDEWTATSR